MDGNRMDLAVIGGGSGGYGAALAAARQGLSVVLVEAAPALGGNSTLAGVNTWEPGICGPGLAAELYGQLKEVQGAICIGRTTHYYSAEKPWGFSGPDPSADYACTLRRSGMPASAWRRVTFEPDAMAQAMQRNLEAAGVKVWLETRCTDVFASGTTVTGLTLTSAQGGREQLIPRYVVDATAQIFLCRQLGCQTMLGSEPRSAFNEPSAPLKPRNQLNGVSVLFRVTPTGTPGVEPLPSGISTEPFITTVGINEYPNGDLNLNPLPVMQGWEWHQRCEQDGESSARLECESRVYRLWHWLQTEKGFANFRMLHLFTLTGVREGPRLVARQVLTEVDVRAGWTAQRGHERIIALADHALDVHGEGHLCAELAQPYGVPLDCLLAREFSNLAVACRGAGFSQLAASTCRLSRTMMDLGHAAGLAVAQVCGIGAPLWETDVPMLRRQLERDGVFLNPGHPTFPSPPKG